MFDREKNVFAILWSAYC